MRFVIYGAGGVGGTIGARLHQQGYDVVLIARGEHGRTLARRGMRFIAPDGEHELQIPTVSHPAEIELNDGDMVLLTMKSQHTSAALDDLLSSDVPDIGLVCAQNGVANERMALRRKRRVYGMLVNLPASHLEPGEVLTYASGKGGVLDCGRYPRGVDGPLRELLAALEQAGFSAEPDADIMRKKYAKLLMNLANALQAATDMAPGSEQIARLLRREGRTCYEAAGIGCASRDEMRARYRDTYQMVDLPGRPRLGGSSWQSIRRGTGNVESDYLNGEIVLLGRLHSVPTPANEVCQELGRQLARRRLPVGHYSVARVQALIERALG